MEKLQIAAVVRDPQAQATKHLAKEGLIPAELYGHGVANLHLSINQNEFEKIFRKAGESTIIEVKAPDGVHNVLIHEVQKHYLNSAPIHVDFYEVKMTEKLTATVALEFIGEADAVKVLGGTLVKVLSEVEVECLPADLPHDIPVDISSLKTFDDSILVKDLQVSDKVTIKTDAEEVIAKVQPPRDVEAELAEPVGEEDVSKVIGVAEETPETAAGEAGEGSGESEEKQ